MSERTKYEATLDVQYGVRVHLLHRKVYGKIRALIAVLSLTAGSAAMISALQAYPHALLVCGLLVAVASAVDVVAGYADRSARHDGWRKQFADLRSRLHAMTVDEIDSELGRLWGEIDDEIEALRVLAYNDVMRRAGHEECLRDEPLASKLVRALA